MGNKNKGKEKLKKKPKKSKKEKKYNVWKDPYRMVDKKE